MILHIAPRKVWESLPDRPYDGDTLESEGFIHCSTLEQVLGPANTIFRGREDLVLLVINPQRLTAELVYEDCYEAGEEFPHIYGPLNRDAVTAVVDFPPLLDGSFILPDQLVRFISN